MKKLTIRHGKFTNLWSFSYSNKTHSLKSKPKKPYQIKKPLKKEIERTESRTKTRYPKNGNFLEKIITT